MNAIDRPSPIERPSPIGSAIPHDSAAKHVSGEALYIDDLPEPPGLLHAYIRLSEHARARITRLDASAVACMPGVAAVLTAADIPGVNDVGPAFPGDPIFARELIEYCGQSLFAVAADSIGHAREAAARAIIECEVLPPVLTVDAALEHKSFVLPTQVMTRGDAATALARAPHRLSGRLDIGGQEHFYLEGQVAMAVPGEDGDMLVYSSTQHPTEVQHLVARALKLADHSVVCETRRMGGAFGGKESQASLIAAVAALLAQRDEAAGEAAAGPGRRHGADRQAPRFPHRLRRGVRCRRAHPRHRVHAGGAMRVLARPVGRDRRPGDVPCRQLLLPSRRPHRVASLQDQHGVQHRLPRFRRPAGHDGHRKCHRRDRAPSGARSADRAAAQFLRQGRPQRHAIPHGGGRQHHSGTGRRTRGTRGLRRTPRGGGCVQRGKSLDQARHRADTGKVRHLLHPDAHEPGRRAGARLYRRQRHAEPWRHRDGPGALYQDRAGGRRGVWHRSRPGEDHRDQHGESAEHVAHRRVVGQRHQRQSSTGGGAHDPRTHGRRGRRRPSACPPRRWCSRTAWCAGAARK